VTSRGWTTSPIPHGFKTFQIDFDFISHRLLIQTSEGKSSALRLGPMPVSEFYLRVMETLATMEVPVSIWTRPVEIDGPVEFEKDHVHRVYDPEYAYRFWRSLASIEQVFLRFRAEFTGKCSPIHFFWGGFDLAVTRFSGRPAPEHPANPLVPAFIVREAYSHEVSSCGYWPGGGMVSEPCFYAYAYPEPPGFKEAAVEPREAFYNRALGEFLLPYEAVRLSDHPEETVLRFLNSTYSASADLGGWDRRALERSL
jgi:hypothetical protein